MSLAESLTEYFPPVEEHAIRSKHVAETFKVQVMQPSKKRGSATRFPVVYATDGNFSFDMLKGISRVLQSSGRDCLPFILVGIGYASDSPSAGMLLRRRDLVFPGYPKLSLAPPSIEGVLKPAHGTPDFAGAESFQEFLATELFPFMDERYDTLTEDRTYFGHSAGGGFGLYTLFTNASLFRNYIISSPGLSFHGRSSGGVDYDSFDFMMQLARKFIASPPSLSATRLFMSVGTEEEFEPELAGWQLTSAFYRMTALMRAAAIPGLRFDTQVRPGETHMSMWPISFIHGIKTVLAADH